MSELEVARNETRVLSEKSISERITTELSLLTQTVKTVILALDREFAWLVWDGGYLCGLKGLNNLSLIMIN